MERALPPPAPRKQAEWCARKLGRRATGMSASRTARNPGTTGLSTQHHQARDRHQQMVAWPGPPSPQASPWVSSCEMLPVAVNASRTQTKQGPAPGGLQLTKNLAFDRHSVGTSRTASAGPPWLPLLTQDLSLQRPRARPGPCQSGARGPVLGVAAVGLRVRSFHEEAECPGVETHSTAAGAGAGRRGQGLLSRRCLLQPWRGRC